MSQIDFAKQLGVSKQFLCGLEHDKKIISAKKIKQFVENLGYSSEQFNTLAIQDSLEHHGLHMIIDVKAA